MIYEVSNLTKVFGERTVLNIPSLHIEESQIYALLGPNGSGKTTLLKILAFLDSPTEGGMSYCSRPVTFSNPALIPLRKEVVMVSQRPILFTTTVFKNLEFGLKIRKIQKDTRRRRIFHALERVGLTHLANAPADKLSGGETQRVAIARALAVSPRVILCDEPTANVDLENQVVIVNLLKQINRDKQITIIFTTHDKTQAASLAKHTLFLDHGKLTTSFYENLFPAEITPGKNGKKNCHISNLTDMELSTSKMGKVRVLINPRSIKVFSSPHTDTRNIPITGEVTQVASEREAIRIVVESKVNITVIMNRDRYREQNLLVGDRVGLLIDPDSVNIL